MKNILGYFTLILLATGCIKDKYEKQPTSGDQSFLKFSVVTPFSTYPRVLYVPNGSVEEEYLSLDDNGLRTKLEGPITAPKDLYLEYKANPEALTKYNADQQTANPSYKPFFLLPDSTYSITVSKDTIKAGEVYASKVLNNVKMYPKKIDPTINYILPLTVTNSDYQSEPGTGTLMFYMVGNPIAGSYTWDYYRWNTQDGTGDLHGSSFTGDVTTFVPTSATEVEVPSGYYIQPRYVIKFTDNGGGSLSDFTIKFNADDVTAMTNGGVTVIDGPNILIADPVAKHYKFQYAVFNGTAYRYLIDDFYK